MASPTTRPSPWATAVVVAQGGRCHLWPAPPQDRRLGQQQWHKEAAAICGQPHQASPTTRPPPGAPAAAQGGRCRPPWPAPRRRPHHWLLSAAAP
eukprot:CAMPEP_0194581354 /NCGR_PEP_ID=MMETSP0292-20121207/14839_1 /TAXON_ID=39354 /ORGANISM="Heterosigma akashiwo, Strain CCMP2393" /LENGTH=94 /DNA_ID=CAMNT_0039435059 /DNA_START=150 /DNA_END=430 /DNA_ORIENTATION=-